MLCIMRVKKLPTGDGATGARTVICSCEGLRKHTDENAALIAALFLTTEVVIAGKPVAPTPGSTRASKPR